MNTTEIYNILWTDDTAAAYVSAVVPCTALRYLRGDRNETCYIVNINKHCGDLHCNIIGHWIAIVIHPDSSLLEVFDSQGLDTYNRDIKRFMTQFDTYVKNTKFFSSNNCGFYCLLYAYYRSRKHDINDVLRKLENISDIKSECSRLYRARPT